MILVSILIIGILLAILSIFFDVGRFFYLEAKSSLSPYFFPERHTKFLAEHFPYYQKLPAKSKAIFRNKVARFMSSKEFIAKEMNMVTDEMKLLISASAVQLTFGFTRVTFPHFYRILVFPEIFYNSSNKAYHKGEVNPKAKAIALSWKHFVEGYLKADGRNLGLHEMAHALRIENRIMNKEYNFLDADLLEEWEKRAKKTMEEINNGQETFFRQYGGVNSEEFFAVAIENFFERPVEFKEKHPQTYSTMCRLLKQDPALLEKA